MGCGVQGVGCWVLGCWVLGCEVWGVGERCRVQMSPEDGAHITMKHLCPSGLLIIVSSLAPESTPSTSQETIPRPRERHVRWSPATGAKV